MKAFKIYSLLAIIILVVSCNSNDNDAVNFAGATPQTQCITNNLTGPTAVYWDYANGIPAPFTSIPMVPNPQGTFDHPDVFTNIRFTVPQNYTVTPLSIPNTAFGVDMRRSNNNPQNKVFWRYYPITSFSGTANIDDIRAFFINDLMVNEYGFNGTPVVDCAPPTQTANFGGITRTFSARAIRFGNTRAIITVAVSPTPFGSSVAVSISAGPINEYDSLAMNVFFPISFELLLPDRDSLSDRDGDGTPDVFDPEPDNPNVK
ncbi:hypothetical protein EYD45_04330 [Hyunsoonleella flava]|uniref:PKD domain-containing protein n=1 Tax=Hyunsoonleella flava TaxID=2527939 RepID=A0A4Q9FFE8_9FLAO|nr:hypothetical protein [Hyunsoonleella flava]TBN05511.1 hypothetical protein EYD45_04330 [Hyunsoonleella flava]